MCIIISSCIKSFVETFSCIRIHPPLVQFYFLFLFSINFFVRYASASFISVAKQSTLVPLEPANPLFAVLTRLILLEHHPKEQSSGPGTRPLQRLCSLIGLPPRSICQIRDKLASRLPADNPPTLKVDGRLNVLAEISREVWRGSSLWHVCTSRTFGSCTCCGITDMPVFIFPTCRNFPTVTVYTMSVLGKYRNGKYRNKSTS